jgi:CBS domain-containing protein
VPAGGVPSEANAAQTSQTGATVTLTQIKKRAGARHRMVLELRPPTAGRGDPMTVGSVCNREVVFVTRATAVPEAARLMREYHVGDLVVIEERNGRRLPVGIVTDRDLVIEVLAAGVEPDRVCVGDVMSGELVQAGEDDDLLDTIRRMREHGVRRLPVVDAGGALTGILSVDDLIDLLAEQVTDLAGLIGREQRRERATRR